MSRFGFVGVGLIGSRRLEVVRRLGHNIAFVVDPDPQRREMLATRGIPSAADAAREAGTSQRRRDP